MVMVWGSPPLAWGLGRCSLPVSVERGGQRKKKSSVCISLWELFTSRKVCQSELLKNRFPRGGQEHFMMSESVVTLPLGWAREGEGSWYYGLPWADLKVVVFTLATA